MVHDTVQVWQYSKFILMSTQLPPHYSRPHPLSSNPPVRQSSKFIARTQNKQSSSQGGFICFYFILYYMHVHLRLIKVIITHEPNMIWRWNLHQSTSLVESHKTLEAHGCKPWVTNLSIIHHTLGILTANIVATWRKACRTSHVTITWHFAVRTTVEPLIHPAFISFSIWL